MTPLLSRRILPTCVIALAVGLFDGVGFAQDRAPRTQPPDMQAIAEALGVECQFCHAPKALTAAGRLRLDVAREMIAMTSELNDRVARATGTDGTRVSCITCHRGVAIPRQLRDILLETAVRQGPDAAIAQYRELRERYYGGQAYDFGEMTLLFVAERLADSRPAAAIALADLHRRAGRFRLAVAQLADMLQRDPYDFETLLLLGRTLLDDRRVEPALEAFRRVLKFDPEHVAALFHCGVALARLHRYREAVPVWEKVIRLDPGGAYSQRARMHARTALDLQHIFATEAE